MILYEDSIKKAVKKGTIPQEVFKRFHNIFIALDATNDLGLFDIKKLKSSEKRSYYRLRKGKFRAIFYIEKKKTPPKILVVSAFIDQNTLPKLKEMPVSDYLSKPFHLDELREKINNLLKK